jgi:hypothetical protein
MKSCGGFLPAAKKGFATPVPIISGDCTNYTEKTLAVNLTTMQTGNFFNSLIV